MARRKWFGLVLALVAGAAIAETTPVDAGTIGSAAPIAAALLLLLTAMAGPGATGHRRRARR